MRQKLDVVDDLKQRRDEENQALVDEVIAEFGGNADAMAQEILYWRSRMRQLVDVVGKIESEEPFAIIGAGPLWKPGERSRWWFR